MAQEPRPTPRAPRSRPQIYSVKSTQARKRTWGHPLRGQARAPQLAHRQEQDTASSHPSCEAFPVHSSLSAATKISDTSFGQPKQELTLIKHSNTRALSCNPDGQSATRTSPTQVPTSSPCSDGQTRAHRLVFPTPLLCSQYE